MRIGAGFLRVVAVAAMVSGSQSADTQAGNSRIALNAEAVPSPAGSATFLPQLVRRNNGDIVATWMQLTGSEYRFQFSVLHGSLWSPARTIASGSDLSHFSADLPGVAETADGTLVAYWQLTDLSGPNKYATVIQIATSSDDGQTWSKPNTPYRNAAPGQHGFLSTFRLGSDLGLVWLDAQAQAQAHSASMPGMDHSMGAIGLRTVTVDKTGRVKADTWINPIVCECCPTSAVTTLAGPVVVFRGRAEQRSAKPTEIHTDAATIRDIQIVRLENGRWTSPSVVHADNWVVNACPDNGPAIDAHGRDLVVAWWTRSGDQPKVQVAFSSDAGSHFGKAIRVDQRNGEGQVSVAWDPLTRSAVVGWLEDHHVWARIVSPEGNLGPPLALGSSPPHARLPTWISSAEGTFASWTSMEGDVRAVRFALLRKRAYLPASNAFDSPRNSVSN